MTYSFNDYLNHGLNFLPIINKLCCEEGHIQHFLTGDSLVSAGQVCQHIGFIKSGYFQYQCQGKNKTFITGFAFEQELVTDYPRCLYHEPSNVTITAALPSTIYIMEIEKLFQFFEQDLTHQKYRHLIAEHLFLQIYQQMHHLYTKTPEERYKELLARCPNIVQLISLKELASFLRVTPTTISTIRHKITFG